MMRSKTARRPTSLTTTIIAATTKASASSRLVTSTSDTVSAFCTCEWRSNDVPPSNAAQTTSKLQREDHADEPDAHSVQTINCPKHSDDRLRRLERPFHERLACQK